MVFLFQLVLLGGRQSDSSAWNLNNSAGKGVYHQRIEDSVDDYFPSSSIQDKETSLEKSHLQMPLCESSNFHPSNYKRNHSFITFWTWQGKRILPDFWTKILLIALLVFLETPYSQTPDGSNSWPSSYLSNKIIKMNHKLLELESIQYPLFQGRIQKMRFKEFDRLLLRQKRNRGQKYLLTDATKSPLDHRAQCFGDLGIRYFLPVLIGRKWRYLRDLRTSLLLKEKGLFCIIKIQQYIS